MNKQGMQAIGEAPSWVISIVLVAAVGAVGLLILASLRNSSVFTAGGAEEIAINNSVSVISNFFALLPVLGTIAAAVLLIGAVVYLFVFRKQ